MRISLSKLQQKIAILLIFLGGVFSPEVILILEFSILLCNYKAIRITNKYLLFFAVFFIHGILGVILKNNEMVLLLKQILGIFGNLIFYASIIDEGNYLSVLKTYTDYSCVLAAFVLLQQVARKMNVSFIYDMRWLVPSQAGSTDFYRSSGIFTEPSACALVLMPAVFFSIYYFIGNNKESEIMISNPFEAIIILMGVICTFSSSGFVGIAFVLILILSEYKYGIKQISIILLFIALFIVAYNYVDIFKMRVDDTVRLFLFEETEDYSNLSTQTLFINYKVALKNFKSTFGMGGGLGSHLIAYKKYSGIFEISSVQLQLNQEDANSLFLRIVSETGILGVAGMVYFIYKNRTTDNLKTNKITQLMCISYFLLRLLRYGHYFNMGFFLFVVVYIVSGNDSKVISQQGIATID